MFCYVWIQPSSQKNKVLKNEARLNRIQLQDAVKTSIKIFTDIHGQSKEGARGWILSQSLIQRNKSISPMQHSKLRSFETRQEHKTERQRNLHIQSSLAERVYISHKLFLGVGLCGHMQKNQADIHLSIMIISRHCSAGRNSNNHKA